MKVVVGDIAGIVVVNFAGNVGEGVPDVRAAAAFFGSAFDLVGGGGASPKESRWELVEAVAWLGGARLRQGRSLRGAECGRGESGGTDRLAEGAPGEVL